MSMGGLGLRSVRDHAPAAYVGSLNAVRDLVGDMRRTEARITTKISQNTLDIVKLALAEKEPDLTLEILTGYNQHTISFHIDKLNSHLVT